MSIEQLIVFKGKDSMTGKAAEKKFPGLDFEGGGSFEGVLTSIASSEDLAILPLWNSHVGEIERTMIIESLMLSRLYIHSIWPGWIEFACIVRKGMKLKDVRRVISMGGVGDRQCSVFIQSIGATFSPASSTPDAYDKFCVNDEFDAVLCSSSLCESTTQEILKENVSNNLNFTTFVLLGKDSGDKWEDPEWDSLRDETLPKNCYLSSIEMPRIQGSLSDEQREMFDMISQDCMRLDEIPKIIFVASKEYDTRVALILEYSMYASNQGFSDVKFSSEIDIVPNAGSTKRLYAEEVSEFITEKLSGFSGKHFIKHTGNNSYFYACPLLNIFIQGFDDSIVESVAKESIRHHFLAYINGVKHSSEEQKDFLDTYSKNFQDDGIDFMTFEDLNP